MLKSGAKLSKPRGVVAPASIARSLKVKMTVLVIMAVVGFGQGYPETWRGKQGKVEKGLNVVRKLYSMFL